MPTPVAIKTPEAANLALLIDATHGGKGVVMEAMKWDEATLAGVVAGHCIMSEDEVSELVGLFGVTEDLMRTHRPNWEPAPEFHKLMAGFLSRLDVTGDITVEYHGKPYRLGGTDLWWEMGELIKSDREVPAEFITDVAKAIGIQPVSMRYLDWSLIADLVTAHQGREHHFAAVNAAAAKLEEMNAAAASLDDLIDTFPQTLPAQYLRVKRYDYDYPVVK